MPLIICTAIQQTSLHSRQHIFALAGRYPHSDEKKKTVLRVSTYSSVQGHKPFMHCAYVYRQQRLFLRHYCLQCPLGPMSNVDPKTAYSLFHLASLKRPTVTFAGFAPQTSSAKRVTSDFEARCPPANTPKLGPDASWTC